MDSVFDNVSPTRHPEENTLVKKMLQERRKFLKQKQKEKKARLVVRNLPFSTTEENLREYYEKFGEIAGVDLLRKSDGKLVGCAFIQFKLVQNAAKARHHTNGKEFIGRTIECDFAMAKRRYEERQLLEETEIKRENEIKTEIKQEVDIKQEPVENYERAGNILNQPVDVKTEEVKAENEKQTGEEQESSFAAAMEEDESDGEAEENAEIKEDEESKPPENSEQHQEEDEEMETDEEEEDQEIDEDEADEEESEDMSETESKAADDDRFSVAGSVSSTRPRVVSNDVVEGKTVFIKNVPFDATNDDLKQCMFQFGPVYYALICVDKLTEHSKGTAFVKFRNAEDAEKCLQAGTELTLLGNILDCHKALSRDEVQTKRNAEKDVRQKDSRNLYLVKEGVILAGTKAAEGVSASDMAKRLQVEQYKTQILRNLNMFVSRYRLIIHNLPASWDDAKLRNLFKRYAGADAVIKEARVMRNLRNVDSKGVGKSKEYGFVSFAHHEHALKALRAINNNPEIFTPQKRPIVAFSIESRTKINAKEKRLINSKLKNPISKSFDPSIVKRHEEMEKKGSEEGEVEPKKFSGTAAKPGVLKMRSRHNLRTQAKLHHEHLKKQKKRLKFEKKKSLEQKKQDFIRQPKQKVNKNPKSKVDDSFSKLVSSYKKKLQSADTTKKSKWYEG